MYRKVLLAALLTLLLFAVVSAGSRNSAVRSPKDRIQDSQILVFDDKVIIYLDNPEWAEFTDTKSMEPVLGVNAHAIEIRPQSPADIQPGDIISYKSNYAGIPIIHRVIRTGLDDQGWYAIVKGDNNSQQDPERVRFEQIKRVVVAIIY